jgi:hypothetical protein
MEDTPFHPPEIELTRLASGVNAWEGTLAGVTKPVCDFCASTQPTTDYPCADFRIGTLVMQHEDGRIEAQDHWNRGGFLACHECSRLIDLGQYAALVRRMTRLWRVKHPEAGDPDQDAFITCVAGFAKHRQGPGRDWEGDASG